MVGASVDIIDLDAFARSPHDAPFRRGDNNGDGRQDMSDVVVGLMSLFMGGAGPHCADAADSNDDGGVDLSDPIAILRTIFLEEGPLPRLSRTSDSTPLPTSSSVRTRTESRGH